MNYSIYNKSTGRISKNVNCIESNLYLQYDINTENYLNGYFDDSENYVENGQIIEIPAKPFPYYVFNWDTKQWFDPRTDETQWIIVKDQRDELLNQSDWTQLPDVSITNKDQWITYRQQLRDITTQTDPFNIIWPSKPE